MRSFSLNDIQNMARITRLTLINAISGFKSGNLIGTVNTEGVTNLALFRQRFTLALNHRLLDSSHDLSWKMAKHRVIRIKISKIPVFLQSITSIQTSLSRRIRLLQVILMVSLNLKPSD